MTNFIIAAEEDALDYTATASSENSDFPASNLALYNHPKIAWRSTGVGAQNIVFDFGAEKTVALVVVDWCNWVDGDAQGNASDDWGAPSHTQAIEVAQNKDVHRYGLYFQPASFSYRYARIAIDAATPTDGAAYFTIGRVMFFESVLVVNENPDASFEWQVERFFKVNKFDGGGQERCSLGPYPRRSGKFSWTDIDRDNSLDDIRTIALMPEDQLIVVCENWEGDGSDFTVCFRDDPIPINWNSRPFATTGSLNYTESI